MPENFRDLINKRRADYVTETRYIAATDLNRSTSFNRSHFVSISDNVSSNQVTTVAPVDQQVSIDFSTCPKPLTKCGPRRSRPKSISIPELASTFVPKTILPLSTCPPASLMSSGTSPSSSSHSKEGSEKSSPKKQCRYCQKPISRSNVNRHENNVCKEKNVVKCNKCDDTFQEQSRKRHMMRKHPDSLTEGGSPEKRRHRGSVTEEESPEKRRRVTGADGDGEWRASTCL